MHSSEFYPDNYTIYRRDRGTDDHGGVVIATMNNLTTTEINKSKIVELISVKIDLRNKKTLIVSSFYRPPKTDEVYIQNYIKEISELNTRYDKAIFCVGGDFNLPDIDWKTGLVNGNNYPHKTSEEIIKSGEDMFMEQVVECSTRGENILDLFFTTHPSLVEHTKTLPPLGKGDHDIVLCDTLITLNRVKKPRRNILLWKSRRRRH
jgi:hypothetical protein